MMSRGAHISLLTDVPDSVLKGELRAAGRKVSLVPFHDVAKSLHGLYLGR